LNITFIPHIRW